MAVKLTKEESTHRLVNLKKEALHVLDLKGLKNQKARVVLALDISISMKELYARHVVQDVCNRLLALSLNFDDNGSADVFLFGVNAHEAGEMSQNNFYDFVEKEITSRHRLEGGTNYAPVMKKIIQKFYPSSSQTTASVEKKGLFGKLFGKSEVSTSVPISGTAAQAEPPVYVLYITDGNNGDTTETERVIREASNKGIFWQFVGVGRERFEFLQKLDDLTGRTIDNADFFAVNDLDAISDQELYDRVLNEFPDWIKEATKNRII